VEPCGARDANAQPPDLSSNGAGIPRTSLRTGRLGSLSSHSRPEGSAPVRVPPRSPPCGRKQAQWRLHQQWHQRWRSHQRLHRGSDPPAVTAVSPADTVAVTPAVTAGWRLQRVGGYSELAVTPAVTAGWRLHQRLIGVAVTAAWQLHRGSDPSALTALGAAESCSGYTWVRISLRSPRWARQRAAGTL
jgi:hypothetical protein